MDLQFHRLCTAAAAGLLCCAFEWCFVLAPPDDVRIHGKLVSEVACLLAASALFFSISLAIEWLPKLSRRIDRLQVQRQAVLGRLAGNGHLAIRGGLAVEGCTSA
eukprot:scaffold231084_cov42-Prasinocladus_malaysianus.AAC.1